MSNTPIKLTVQQILKDLQEGQTRPEIQKKYGLTVTDLTELFKHEKLKGKKTLKKRVPGFILTDEDDVSNAKDNVDSQEVSTDHQELY